MAQQNEKRKPKKKLAATPAQLAAGVTVPTGRPVQIVVGKRKFAFSA